MAQEAGQVMKEGTTRPIVAPMCRHGLPPAKWPGKQAVRRQLDEEGRIEEEA